MWKPADKIKYAPDPGPWPTLAEVRASKLFSPVRIGEMVLAERSWVPAMVPWRATEDGAVSDDVLDWYGTMARGQPGGLVIEATGIRDIPSGPLLRIGHDRFLPGLKQLVDRVREESGGRTKLFIQLIDFLSIKRRPPKDKYLQRFLQITDRHKEALGDPTISEEDARAQLMALENDALQSILSAREFEELTVGYRERVTDTHLPHIANLPKILPELFAKAAVRAQKAGIDGVELHYAHAYTMASFMSALNNRNDGYGGSLEGRAKLPLHVFKAVRKAVGNDYPVGCRFLADEIIEGGSNVADACYFAEQFAAAGMDFLSTSRGGKFDDAKQPAVGQAAYPYTGRSGYECMPGHLSDPFGPFGRNIGPTAQIKNAIVEAGYDTPVVVSGGIHGFKQAEEILQAGQADLVGAARQTLADPFWFKKMRLGRGAEVRSCEYTNYCEGLDQKHKMVTCQLWDRLSLNDADVKRTPDGKRRTTAPDWKE